MGREVRRVPPNWEHPRWTDGNSRYAKNVGEYRSCHDETYADAAQAWTNKFLDWENGVHPERERVEREYGYRYIWEWEGMPPDTELYRPAFTEEPTWFQLYETVSEGSPQTPPFETEEELIHYLCTQGEFAHGRYPNDYPIPTREQAAALVKQGGGMTLIVTGKGQVLNTYEAAEEFSTSGE